MFGTLKPSFLEGCSKGRYQASFCGSCHAMAELGRPWALASGYDIAFLHQVMCALEEAPVEKLPCTALPFKKLPVRRLSDENRRWLAAFNILLIEQKCHDDVMDEGSWKGRLGLRVISTQAEKAGEVLRRMDFPLEQLLTLTKKQCELEQRESLHLEHLAQPTSLLLGEVFAQAGRLTGLPQKSQALRHLGQGLGAAIYIKDAMEDVDKDQKSGQFNAVVRCVNGPSAAEVLSREYGRALYGLHLLGLPAKEQQPLDLLLAQFLPEQEAPKPKASSLLSPRRRHAERGCIDDLLCGCCMSGGGELCAACSTEACCNGAAFCPCPCDCAVCCSNESKTTAATPQVSVTEPAKPKLPCPACGSDLELRHHGTVAVDECDSCYGIWLDHGELETLCELQHLHPRFSQVRPVYREIRPEGTRPCPHCAEMLVGTKVKGVRLDLCTECQGLWLDQGELNRLLERD